MCGRQPCDKVDCTWSEKFRFECEARDLMEKPFDVRQAYYKDVIKRRGEAAQQKLIKEVNSQWALAERHKNAKGTPGKPPTRVMRTLFSR